MTDDPKQLVERLRLHNEAIDRLAALGPLPENIKGLIQW